MANTAGGVITLGVEEDKQARAVGMPGVPINDDQRSRMRQVVASLVAPYPTFDMVTVDLETPGRAVVLIAVLRSPAASHAVVIKEKLRYPAATAPRHCPGLY